MESAVASTPEACPGVAILVTTYLVPGSIRASVFP
jgi:hypothetical protein